MIVGAGNFGGGTSPFTYIFFNSTDNITWYDYNVSYQVQMTTSAVFRDPSSWYHISFVWDGNNGTATEKARIYVNGIRQSMSYGVTTNGTQSVSLNNYSYQQAFGQYLGWAGASYFDGYVADVNFVDS